jgi:RNA polymerase sigma factor (sigma-70 family)
MLLAETSFRNADKTVHTTSSASAASVDGELAELLPLVRAVIAAVLGDARDHPDVEDGASETMRRGVEGKVRLRPGEPLKPWVVGIARHVALDVLRARKRGNQRRAREPSRDEGDDRPPLYEELPDPSPSPFERFAKAQEQDKIRKAMNDLPEGQRKALTMFHLDGLGYQEIAGRLDVPLGTVATWVTRGRKAVALALRDPAREEGEDAS